MYGALLPRSLVVAFPNLWINQATDQFHALATRIVFKFLVSSNGGIELRRNCPQVAHQVASNLTVIAYMMPQTMLTNSSKRSECRTLSTPCAKTSVQCTSSISFSSHSNSVEDFCGRCHTQSTGTPAAVSSVHVNGGY
eukprot:3761663-Pleurochrysis_carterae.AAC.1